jgi:hypothetical protein
VNEGLKKILPGRAFGSRLGKRSIFKQRPKQQLNARVIEGDGDAVAPAAAGDVTAAGTAMDVDGATPSTNGQAPAAAATDSRPASGQAAIGGSGGFGSKGQNKIPLGVDELLFVLKRDPVYSRSAIHYRIRGDHAAAAAAAAVD